VFNALVSLGALEGADVIDLFAGSGALGIEALSRGADSCLFVESDSRALVAIRENLRTLGLEGRSVVIAGRAETVMSSGWSSGTRADLVLADPPYGYQGWGELMTGLEPIVSDGGIVVIESGTELELMFADSLVWRVIRSKRYGRTWVTFLERAGVFTD
jgi:16S rRNA (guanine966-N2)-methyltransferase